MKYEKIPDSICEEYPDAYAYANEYPDGCADEYADRNTCGHTNKYTGRYADEYPAGYIGEYAICDELFCRESEAELSLLFEELDALILDNLPASLVTTPAELIRTEFERKTGLYLTRQEIVDAYLRFAGGHYE